MDSNIPLAKSPKENLATLEEHLQEVEIYLKELLEAYYFWLKQFIPDADAFIKDLLFAAQVHDLGKVAEGFQRFLKEGIQWDFRHEVLSLALLDLEYEPRSCKFYAQAAILTHHKNIDDELLLRATGAKRAPIFLNKIKERQKRITQELSPYQKWLQNYLAKINLPLKEPNFEAVRKFHEVLLEESSRSTVLQNTGFKLTIARGALMAADYAASFGVKNFLKTLNTPKLSKNPRPFQKQASNHHGNLILEAPTGTGKTEAALRWIFKNRQAGERIFYVLPTRASIHAMYHTLQESFGKEYVGFIHAKALNYLFEQYDTGNYEETYRKARYEKDLNRLVHKPLKVLTPFQIIKWFFGLKRFEIGFLELLGGLFVFDEIHAYDPHTIALILEILALISRFGGRCLLMSATLPDFLLTEIERSLPGISYQSLNKNNPIEKELLTRPRHRIFFRKCYLEELLEEIVSLSRNRRVLVVANRVDQAQTIYQRLRERFGPDEVFLLHNRFTYEDRHRKERLILEILKENKPTPLKILVATQVIEVSLDISFEAMFTEIAPVDDLLQRMGRVNRYGETQEPAEIHIATSYTKSPYDCYYLKKALESRPHDGTTLNAEQAAFWLKEAYKDGLSKKDQENFITARESFRRLIENLKPMRGSREEEYFELFETYEVLPISKFELFKDRLDKGETLKAFGLLVPVYRAFWHKMKSQRLLESYEGKVVLAQVKYDPELGLLEEPDLSTDFL